MADAMIYDLTAKTAPALTDEFELQETSGGDSKKITFANLFNFPEANNIILGTSTGTKIGTAVTQKLGFWNATPIVQPASADQAALTDSTGGTADGTLSAAAHGLTNSTGGTADGTMAAVSGSGDDTNINNNFTEVYTALGALVTVINNNIKELYVKVNEHRNVLVNTGLMKGSA